MKGPEWEMLNRDQQKQFLRQEFGVSSQSNRMGIRLTGDPMLRSGDGTKTSCSGDGTTNSSASGTMTSSAVLPGTIQLPGNGLPIILMKDAQAVGGYARIAKVLNEDLWRLGQVWTRNTIRFELVEVGATSYTTSETTPDTTSETVSDGT
jgi:allophanate hydrolase subunit 2